MALSVRNNVSELVLALVATANLNQDGYTDSLAKGYFHRDLTQTTSPSPILQGETITLTTVTVSAPTAVDLPSTLILTNQLFGVLNLHMADDQVHLIKDGYNLSALAAFQQFPAVDLPSAVTLLNELKVVFNHHLTQSGVHQNNDNTNTCNTANATNLATSETLANALATDLNAHMASAPTGNPRIRILSQ